MQSVAHSALAEIAAQSAFAVQTVPHVDPFWLQLEPDITLLGTQVKVPLQSVFAVQGS